MKMSRHFVSCLVIFLIPCGAFAGTFNLSGTLDGYYVKNDTIRIKDATVYSSGDLECLASRIEIKDQFHARSGSYFRARANPLLAEVDVNNMPLRCHADNNQPLFKDVRPNDYIEVYIEADFDQINDPTIPLEQKAQASSSGMMEYTHPQSGATKSISNVMVYARGKSRYGNCGYRPLKIDFLGNQNGTIFENGADEIKIVTHCGYLEGQSEYLAGTPEEQRRRLFQEYYLYQMLQTLQTTSLLTRLALITYHNTSDGSELTEWAFFREREEVAAARCGMVEMDDEDYGSYPANPLNHFQGRLHNRFMAQYDEGITASSGTLCYTDRNTVVLQSPDNKAYFIPFDWDMSCIIQPDYIYSCHDETCLQCPGISVTAAEMYDLLSEGDAQVSKAQALSLYLNEDEMRNIAAESLFDADGAAALQSALNYNFNELHNYLL